MEKKINIESVNNIRLLRHASKLITILSLNNIEDLFIDCLIKDILIAG